MPDRDTIFLAYLDDLGCVDTEKRKKLIGTFYGPGALEDLKMS